MCKENIADSFKLVGQILQQSMNEAPQSCGPLVLNQPLSVQALSTEEYNELLKMMLVQMSGQQFAKLLEACMMRAFSIVSQNQPKKNLVYGIDGLAELLHKSKSKAQRLKSSGVIDEAISQDGNTIIIDGDRALELIHENDMKEKKEKQEKRNTKNSKKSRANDRND